MSAPTHTTPTSPIIGNFRILQGFLNRIALLLVRRLGTGRVEGGLPLMFLYILTKNRSWHALRVVRVFAPYCATRCQTRVG